MQETETQSFRLIDCKGKEFLSFSCSLLYLQKRKKSLKDIVQQERKGEGGGVERRPRLGRQSNILEVYLKGPKPLKCKKTTLIA
jgi:hypothetical protein